MPDAAELNRERQERSDIAQVLVAAAKGQANLARVVGQVLRDSIDGVIKTPKTGRRFYIELQNSEKTYIGTVVEIELRTALELSRGNNLDLHINGHDVDVKFSSSTSWMIPPEAVGHHCVLIAADENSSRFKLGIFTARPELLNAPNRDKKRSISVAGRNTVHWIFTNEPYPSNFWQSVSEAAANRIADGKSGNARVVALFEEVQDRPVTRKIVEDVARQKDFTRRLRSDANHGARDILRQNGILVFSGSKVRDRRAVSVLGLPAIRSGEYLAHRMTQQDAVLIRLAGLKL